MAATSEMISMTVFRSRRFKPEWSASVVADRIEEAADVQKRMRVHGVWPAGYRSTMPEYLQDWEGYGWSDEPTKTPLPSADEISRMEGVVGWILRLDPWRQRLLWARGYGIRWKIVCVFLQCGKTKGWRLWVESLHLIADHLNKPDDPNATH